MIHGVTVRSATPRRVRRPTLLPLAVLALLLVGVGRPASAQHPGGGGPIGGGPLGGQQGGMGGGPFGRPSGFPGSNNGQGPERGGNEGSHSRTMRGGLQLAPPGRWWSDDLFAKDLGLDRNQQHRMDEIFKANKGQLIQLFKGLRHEESQLDKVSRNKVLDEAQIDAQIDKVVQARGDLEKANAHMLLEIRKQMTPEQTAKLDDRRPAPPPNED